MNCLTIFGCVSGAVIILLGLTLYTFGGAPL